MKALIFLYALLAALPAQAQTSMYREVPQGEVSGLEMGIEGTLHVTRGSRLRWFVTVYEIVHGRTLRPAADATLSAEASFRKKEPLAKAVTDANGRAELAFEIPADENLAGSFELIVKARARQVSRQFEVTIEIDPQYRVELEVDKQIFEPGETVFAWGRVMDETRARPAAKREVRITAVDKNRQPVASSQILTTDEAGFFHHTLPAPMKEGVSFDLAATLVGDAGSAQKAGLSTARAKIPALVIQATPLTPVVAPGTEVLVSVVVRTRDGRPVPRATLTGLSIPVGTAAKPVPPILTDAQGHAKVPWKVTSSEPLADVTGELHAVREGLGTADGKVQVRVTRRTHLLSWAVEGSALVPALPGQLFVRLHKPEGQPLVGTEVRLTGERLSAATARTDEQGVAVLETTLGPARAATSPSCSGDTVAAATLLIGTEEEELCLPVDPDATVRVRVAPLLTAGRPTEVRLQRVAAVAQVPIEVALLRSPAPGRWLPIAQTLVAAGNNRAMLEVPAEALGLLWVRARPLLGPRRHEIRGGGTTAWSAPGRPPRLSLRPGKGELQVGFDGGHDKASGFVLALPVAAGRQLLAHLNSANLEAASAASLGSLRGYLAQRTPTDEGVSAILREGILMPLPAPTDPVAQGRLRDPLRAQERFVRGRLARILKAMEDRIEKSIPDHLNEVAFRSPQGWRWNRELLNLLLPELKAEGLVGLDGSPLTIEALQAIDPTITFDNAARRITRERLFHLYVALEHFVKSKQLNYAWARRGDPSRWLLGLLDWNEGGAHDSIKTEQLFDAWGHPFSLQRSRDASPRFRFLEPIPGWEIVSAGPDGRLNTADDLAVPFARILASGTIYAEAVGEDLLLARLQQVELGRATIAALGEVFEIKIADAETESDSPRSSWQEPPPPLPDTTEALAPAAVLPEPASGSFSRFEPAANRVPLALSALPRRYLLVAGAYGPDGATAFAASRHAGGVPAILDLTLPERMGPSETVRVPLSLTYLGPPQPLRVRAESALPLTVRAPLVALPFETGEARTIELELTAAQPGSAPVHIAVVDASGAVLLETHKTVRVVRDGALRVWNDGRFVVGTDQARLTLPGDAEVLGARLVVSGARDLITDPGFAGLSRAAPALAAWAYAQRGQRPPPQVAAQLAVWAPGSGAMSALEVACAVVAFSTAGEASADLSRAFKWLAARRPVSWRERSAVLAALAAGATAPTAQERGNDLVAILLRQIREESWESLATEQGHPTVMARLAAGLLLSDRRDAIGRELFNRARAALVADGHGGRVLLNEESALDAWIGSAALAVAARQLGEDGVAEELARGIAPRLFLGMRMGMGASPEAHMDSDVEAGFWLLAASAYGAFGAVTPEEVEVEVAGARHRLKLTQGSAALKLPTADARVRVRSTLPVLLRLEAHFRQSAAARSGAPLTVRIDGHVGHAAETAALELTIEGTGKQRLTRPVIELEVPGIGGLSEEALARLLSTPGVVRIEAPDPSGILRIYLTALDPHQPRRLPLPIQWQGSGRVRGLALTAYNADQPWLMTTLPARPIEIQPAPRESW